MQLDLPELPAFKYKHGTPVRLSRIRLVAGLVFALAGVVALFKVIPLGIGLLIVAAAVFFLRDRKILLAPRYLLCGESLIYYARVSRIDYSEIGGCLSLRTVDGKSFLLERDKFPTNARKAPKVAANKAAKFVKVSHKIIEKVRLAAPGAEITGL